MSYLQRCAQAARNSGALRNAVSSSMSRGAAAGAYNSALNAARSLAVPAAFRLQAAAPPAQFSHMSSSNSAPAINTGFAASGVTSTSAGGGEVTESGAGEGTAVCSAASGEALGKRKTKRRRTS